MHDLIKFAKVMGVVLAVVLVGIAVGMLGTTGTQVTVQSSPGSPPPGTPPAGGATPSRAGASAPGAPAAEATASQTAAVSASLLSPPAAAATNWQERLDEVLSSDATDPDKARQLLQLFPLASNEGKAELAQHLSNLVPDEDYALLGSYLTNSTSPEEVLDVLLSDLLNRPDRLKLPLLLEVARSPQHPKAAEAKDLMELYLEEDYGTDWNLWRTKVYEYLKANPGE